MSSIIVKNGKAKLITKFFVFNFTFIIYGDVEISYLRFYYPICPDDEHIVKGSHPIHKDNEGSYFMYQSHKVRL